jgi:hypothetical protein
MFRVCGAVVKLLRLVNCLLNNQRGAEEKGKSTPERKEGRRSWSG